MNLQGLQSDNMFNLEQISNKKYTSTNIDDLLSKCVAVLPKN